MYAFRRVNGGPPSRYHVRHPVGGRPMPSATLSFSVNGQQKSVTTESTRPLLDVLREDLQLTGTKYGCGEAKCGACTVLLDGKRVYSCQTEVSEAAGKQVTTIEGIARGEELHPVQQAF